MKKTLLLLVVSVLSVVTMAQSPESMSYQAVVRNSASELLVNTTIGMQVSILQGSSTGSVVYAETQLPVTNANALISIEIGTGNTTSGTFATIDWSNGPFFIKTEVDPDGGTNYTITGTSQLLSVPYALYANKAGNVFSGDYNDLNNKPDFVNPTAFADSISTLRSLIADLDKRLKALEPQPLAVGDTLQGGVVVYIYKEGDAGFVEGEEHGIICSVSDTSGPWSGGIFTNVIGTSGNIGTGDANMTAIINSSGAGNAAGAARAYESNGYDDWFLPSSGTLLQMCGNQEAINAGLALMGGNDFVADYYWSSTQNDFNFASRIIFTNCGGSNGSKSNNLKVRPVRKF